ncbi:hypothetical protein EDD37DRAFT_439320 [Exophiala viscosa]|uniref:uncharacterized protein n=1 Tax=Exophiala viscosa TaxID=2486360 RepID=UPI002195C828|nr:hypothetical protein EDD37DRAFT_439320 [Exophiala viscosa]
MHPWSYFYDVACTLHLSLAMLTLRLSFGRRESTAPADVIIIGIHMLVRSTQTALSAADKTSGKPHSLTGQIQYGDVPFFWSSFSLDRARIFGYLEEQHDRPLVSWFILQYNDITQAIPLWVDDIYRVVEKLLLVLQVRRSPQSRQHHGKCLTMLPLPIMNLLPRTQVTLIHDCRGSGLCFVPVCDYGSRT